MSTQGIICAAGDNQMTCYRCTDHERLIIVARKARELQWLQNAHGVVSRFVARKPCASISSARNACQ